MREKFVLIVIKKLIKHSNLKYKKKSTSNLNVFE